MMRVADKTCSMTVLALVCVAMSAASLGLARADMYDQSKLPNTNEGLLPFLPPGLPADAQKCWASFQSIEGCVEEIFQSILMFGIQPLGPACCKAIVAINDSCWPKMFPFNPFFPPLLKNYCVTTHGGSLAAKLPTQLQTLGSSVLKRNTIQSIIKVWNPTSRPCLLPGHHLPFHPFFPPFVKYCDTTNGGPSPATPPTQPQALASSLN